MIKGLTHFAVFSAVPMGASAVWLIFGRVVTLAFVAIIIFAVILHITFLPAEIIKIIKKSKF